MFYLWIFTFSLYEFLPKKFQSVHEFQEAWFSLKIRHHLVFTLMQKSSCAWNTDTKMTQKLNWIFKKIILYICIAGLTSKTPTGRENCSLISMILSNFPRNVNYCYCCYQLCQQRRLAIMMSKRLKWNNSLDELLIIIHWEIAVNVWNEIIHSVNYRL